MELIGIRRLVSTTCIRLVREGGYPGRHVAVGALGGGRGGPWIAEPATGRHPAQADQAVRRLGLDGRDVPHAVQLDLGLERALTEDHEVAAAQVRGQLTETSIRRAGGARQGNRR
jgi:hypothetical protein